MGLKDCKVLKNSVRTFSNKRRLNIVYKKTLYVRPHIVSLDREYLQEILALNSWRLGDFSDTAIGGGGGGWLGLGVMEGSFYPLNSL